MSTILHGKWMATPDLVAGFMYGMTQENKLLEIEACYKGTESMVPEVEFAIAAFKEGGWDPIMQGILELGMVVAQIPIVLKGCESMSEDLKAIEQWGLQFAHPGDLSKQVAKHYALHRKAISADIADIKTHWAAHEFFKTGKCIAIGPITPVYPPAYMVNGLPNSFEVKSIPTFIAGMLYGFTGDNQLTVIESCYNGGE